MFCTAMAVSNSMSSNDAKRAIEELNAGHIRRASNDGPGIVHHGTRQRRSTVPAIAAAGRQRETDAGNCCANRFGSEVAAADCSSMGGGPAGERVVTAEE